MISRHLVGDQNLRNQSNSTIAYYFTNQSVQITRPAQHFFFCSVQTSTQLSLRFIFPLDFLSSTNAFLLFLSLVVHLGSCLWFCLGKFSIDFIITSTSAFILFLFLLVHLGSCLWLCLGILITIVIVTWFNLSKVHLLLFFCFTNTLFFAGSPDWLICGQSCSKTFFLNAGFNFWLL